MSKQQMISQIVERLNNIGVFPDIGTRSDVLIDCEFLDAAWGSGKKKIE